MTPAARTTRQIRQALTYGEPPAGWRCRICGEGGSTPQATPCEGACGAWLHWPCYWPGMLTPAERTAYAAAEIVDDQRDDDHTVELWVKDRQFKLPAAMMHSAVEDFLDHQIVLCPGCRS